MMMIRVFHDGNQWCALIGPNIQEGLAGFGDTPEAAIEALSTEDIMFAFWEWMRRMQRRFGSAVWAKPGHGSDISRWGYDWGQALCRECYGADSAGWPAQPSIADMERAWEWDAGDWPEWVHQSAPWSGPEKPPAWEPENEE